METYAGLHFAPAYVDYVITYTSIMTGKPLASWAGLLTGRPEGASGSVVVSSMEGTRPLLLEIQALVCHSYFNVPRRTSVLSPPCRTGRTGPSGR